MTDVTELLAVLAHEMRTPIAAILGYQELLSEGIYGDIGERTKEPLDRIAYSAHQLLHLIDGVQEIGTPEAKRLSMQIEQFEPSELLRSCLANAHADATGRHVLLETHIADALPTLQGDPERFCRAIDLALAAAIKTSHGATIELNAHAAKEGVDVAITGTGLAPDRDSPDTVRLNGGRLTGAGLRLAIVREIARQMHGRLELRAESAGTTVSLHFESAEAK
jgi:two-component system cell cycle sensor histidine kinase PleC